MLGGPWPWSFPVPNTEILRFRVSARDITACKSSVIGECQDVTEVLVQVVRKPRDREGHDSQPCRQIVLAMHRTEVVPSRLMLLQEVFPLLQAEAPFTSTPAHFSSSVRVAA